MSKSTSMARFTLKLCATTLLLLMTRLQTQAAKWDESETCSVGDGTACYWALGIKYIVRGLVAQLTMEVEHLNVLCQHITLPPLPVCGKYYASCGQEEKDLFTTRERAYRNLRKKILDQAKCEELAVLNSCTDKKILLGCRIRLLMVPTAETERNNFEAVTNFSQCLDDAVKTCFGPGTQNAKNYVQLSAVTLTEMFSQTHESQVSVQEATSTAVAPSSASARANSFSRLNLILATLLLMLSLSPSRY